MIALRVQVERVVRPIRASSLRKDRVREELLAHLTRLFDEELARTGDAQSATAEAIRRFGDAPALARELQTSVPWPERWAFIRLPYSGPMRRRRDESPVRYLLRANSWGAAAGSVGYVLMALMVVLTAGQRPHRPFQPSGGQVVLFLLGVSVLQSAAMVAMALLFEGLRQALEDRAVAVTGFERRRAGWRMAGYAVLGSAMLASATAVLLLLFEGLIPVPLVSREQFWWITLGAAVAGLPVTLLQGWSWRATTRRYENWDSLDLDEQPAA